MSSILQNFGQYQILEKLGRGGMADVYLAVNRQTNLRIALKLVEHGASSDSQEILEAERLGAELQQLLSRIESRVPQIYAFGEVDGYFFIEMEFIEGNDLSAIIGSGALSADDAARIAFELCGILRNAHGMSLQIRGRDFRAIIHGDIKPRNIRIDTAGQVRVLDFGIAKGLSITRRLTSNIFGSAAYSSPERLESGRMDEMSDLWSVGVVLYEMVEGRLPFAANQAERIEAVIRSMSAPKPFTKPCPLALQQIIHKALNSSPAWRYQKAEDFESDLEAFLTGKVTRAALESEETRRTIPPEMEKTRRTSTQNGSQDANPIFLTQDWIQSGFRKWIRNPDPLKKWIVAGLLLIMLSAGTWEFFVVRSAMRLKPDLVEKRLDGDGAWERYETIRRHSALGIAPLVVRGSLQTLLRQDCDRVFDEYRNSDVPKVREGDWIRCTKYLAHALQLNSSDKKSSAMLEYANGHVLRINRKSLDAIAAFQRAASIQPKWPDPYLGMARTYIHNLGDMERGTHALERAQQLGVSFGKRELAMMAETRRTRGQQALDNANLLRGTEREKEFLNKAKSEFEEALKTYLQITPWGDSTKQILAIQESLAKVEQRIQEVNPPNSLLPWNWLK